MMQGQAPRSDEAHAMCERAEDYMRKIRSKELRFTEEANKCKMYDGVLKDYLPLPQYARAHMDDYNETQVEEAEIEIRLKHVGKEPIDGFDRLLALPYQRKQELRTLGTVKHTKFLIARNFLRGIDQALTNPTPLLVEGEAYFSRLEECKKEKEAAESERDQFRNQIEQLSSELISVRALYDECERKRHIHPAGNVGNSG